jgi:hypothetical protein
MVSRESTVDSHRSALTPNRRGFYRACRYWDPYYYRTRRYQLAENKEMGFLESVFSFVFGDGDPNDNLDDLRYEQIANVIKANGARHWRVHMCHNSCPPPTLASSHGK